MLRCYMPGGGDVAEFAEAPAAGGGEPAGGIFQHARHYEPGRGDRTTPIPLVLVFVGKGGVVLCKAPAYAGVLPGASDGWFWCNISELVKCSEASSPPSKKTLNKLKVTLQRAVEDAHSATELEQPAQLRFISTELPPPAKAEGEEQEDEEEAEGEVGEEEEEDEEEGEDEDEEEEEEEEEQEEEEDDGSFDAFALALKLRWRALRWRMDG